MKTKWRRAAKRDSAQFVTSLLWELYRKQDELDMGRIGIEWLANKAARRLDPDHQAPIHVQYLSFEYLKQLSRMIVRKADRTLTPQDLDENQLELLDELQPRYVVNGQAVRREYLTKSEYLKIIARMESSSVKLAEHARKLKHEMKQREKDGGLIEA